DRREYEREPAEQHRHEHHQPIRATSADPVRHKLGHCVDAPGLPTKRPDAVYGLDVTHDVAGAAGLPDDEVGPPSVTDRGPALTVVDIEGWSRNKIQAERPDVLNYANDTTRLHVEHAQILFKRAVATAHARLDVSGK